MTEIHIKVRIDRQRELLDACELLLARPSLPARAREDLEKGHTEAFYDLLGMCIELSASQQVQ